MRIQADFSLPESVHTLVQIPLTSELSVILVLLLTVRILFEKEFLKRGLEGYEAYMKEVRYGLIPFLFGAGTEAGCGAVNIFRLPFGMPVIVIRALSLSEKARMPA